jgi:hypothetical protein
MQISPDLPEWLAGELRVAFTEWQRGSEEDDVQLRRFACLRQLRAFREVARQLTDEPNATEPIAQLMSALLAASQGATHPLLTPIHRQGGRPPVDLLPQLKRARAAAAFHLLIEAGISRDEAAARVITYLRSVGVRIFTGQGKAPLRDLIRLRDRLRSRDGTPATNFYWKCVREVRDRTPEEGARWLLAGFDQTDAA